MTALKIIRDRTAVELASLQQTLTGLEGVSEEHLETMARAGTGQGMTGRTPLT